MSIYLDNAATTALDPNVLEAMLPYLKGHYGNPSSTHALGRATKGAVETARKKIADLLDVTPAEIVFTSGGTEADNLALRGAVRTHGVQNLITTKLEHHAVLHTMEDIAAHQPVKLHFVETDKQGAIRTEHLHELLKAHPKALVSLMHGNNEIGNLNNLEEIGALVHEFDGLFHSDTVQTMGHFEIPLASLDYAAASAHKFHGPKGVGFAFMSKNKKVKPQQTGGSQERGLRGGTHNVAGIVGLATALEKAIQEQETHKKLLLGLKKKLRDGLKSRFSDLQFHGLSAELDKSLYTVLNVGFPESIASGMLLFQLDIHGICASGGSACSSGSVSGSHVIQALGITGRVPVRFSFGKYNTEAEIDRVLEVMEQIAATQQTSV